MRKLQLRRMQKITAKADALRLLLRLPLAANGYRNNNARRSPIQCVPDNGVADGRHVYADLVGPARLDLYRHQRELAVPSGKSFQNLVVRDGAPATLIALCRHARAANLVAAYGSVDGPRILFQVTVNQRE